MITRSFVVRIAAIVGLMGSFGAVALGQSIKDSLVIYAQAGRINHVTGSAHVRRGAEDAGTILTVSDELKAGDIVETGADAQLEVLLNPGSYLRLGGNSEFEMRSTTLDDIRIVLRRGSAVIETGGGVDDTQRIQIAAGGATAIITKKGVYRINRTPDGAQFLANSGQFTLGPQTVKVKSGNQVTVAGSTVNPVTKFDKNTTRDALDNWSRERAEFLAKANRQLDDRSMDLAMNQYGSGDGFLRAVRGQIGFWAFSSFRGYCMFVPFDPWGWSSPYGVGYSNGNWWNWNIYPRANPNYGFNNGNPNGTGTGNSSTLPAPIKTPDPALPVLVPSGGPRGGTTAPTKTP